MYKNILLSFICILVLAPDCLAENAQNKDKLSIRLIRNATMKITYAGHTFLTDPMLSPKGTIRPFAGIERNPTVDLPLKTSEITKAVDCVLVTHIHPDHFDTAACEVIAREMPFFCQAGDEGVIKNAGFKNVDPVETFRKFKGVDIIRIGGKHGSGKILEHMGNVSGFILAAKGQPTVYWVGDSVWCDEVKDAVGKYKPDVIITHSGGAKIPGFDPIVMDAAQTIKLAQAAPKALIVAIHMESLDHCEVTRKALRDAAEKAGIPAARLVIPKDGETVSF
ncbi:MAG TPA: MBL fold metallo-hydrolase [Candidatus Wallbacteria bacterium]|nr:MBL fold metallo-hydrolase [Candidatus Wallbacteria bacterium]